MGYINYGVLNLIINGIPSILCDTWNMSSILIYRFKPYYKWNTFNTQQEEKTCYLTKPKVLNLIINGIPSIHQVKDAKAYAYDQSFKPYYKWNTFNTIET